MVELLFGRLPPAMRRRAISRLARFVTTNTLPSVTQVLILDLLSFFCN